MRVLVTGAAGYLGRAVVTALAAAGHQPIAMVRTGEPIPDAVETRTADLLDPGPLASTLTGIDAVCHLAGLTRARESITDPLPYFRVNTGGTITLLEAMRTAEVRHLVLASTCAIYGAPAHQPMTEHTPDAPPHPYAASKLAAEFAVTAQAHAGDLTATVLRLPNLAGGNDTDPTRLIPRTLTAAATGTPLQINGDGTTLRDYLHITDAAAAFPAALHRPGRPAARYNLGTGRGTSIMDVIAAAERITARPIPRHHNPAAPEPAALVIDPTLARTELAWTPNHSDLDTILTDTWSTWPPADSPRKLRR
ncbi:NAD-dependent epimerase/dehydratase family protein [Nocardia inohanensis]|uniref:NAD-dependent epimerase/dehydratase family protein n=1 Tax=Nocardia inohanensis TaxID=209246 RepID=UPI0008341CFD|nr:NAD-dependent epimerase/dehydratase family protein [Nocardia inohanensis]